MEGVHIQDTLQGVIIMFDVTPFYDLFIFGSNIYLGEFRQKYSSWEISGGIWMVRTQDT